ncbi:hypothetical protein GEMRC1_004798 [Eukaryota sp. GEM-RC1]
MKHINDHLEHQLLMKQTPFSELPSDFSSLCSRSDWTLKLRNFSFDHQLLHSSALEMDETQYYHSLITSLKSSLSLYPYHLAQLIFKHCAISPFKFYTDMLSDTISSETSYDQIPNFTAADIERIMGIGRNQFIDLMNTLRKQSKTVFFRKKPAIQRLLPSKPIPFSPPQWSHVELGIIRHGDLDNLSETEVSVIALLKDGPMPVTAFAPEIISSLYSHDFIFFSFPVSPSDVFVVPVLESFVMNKLNNDWLEGVLYDTFVALNGSHSISNIASTLSLPTSTVVIAASVLSRLGLVFKRINASGDQSESGDVIDDDVIEKTAHRLCLFCDASLAGLFMMGQFGNELKKWGQNLFEVGKVEHHAIKTVTELLRGSISSATFKEFSQYDVTRSRQFALSFISIMDKFLKMSDLPFDLVRIESVARLKDNVRSKMIESYYTHAISLSKLSLPPLPRSITNFSFSLPLQLHWWVRLYCSLKVESKGGSYLLKRGGFRPNLPSRYLDEVERGRSHVMIESMVSRGQPGQYLSNGERVLNCSDLYSFLGLLMDFMNLF